MPKNKTNSPDSCWRKRSLGQISGFDLSSSRRLFFPFFRQVAAFKDQPGDLLLNINFFQRSTALCCFVIKLNTREKGKNNVANNCRQRQVNVLKIVLMTPTHRVISTPIALDKTTSSKVPCSQVPQPNCCTFDKMLLLQLEVQARFSWQNVIFGAILQVWLLHNTLQCHCKIWNFWGGPRVEIMLSSNDDCSENIQIKTKCLWKFDWKEVIYLWWQVHWWACQCHLPRGSSGKCLKEWDEVLPNNWLLQTGGRL